MTLDVDIGLASERGRRSLQEDAAAALRPAPEDAARGVLAALADGVSAGGGGLEAAQTTVLSLLADYFATPATWETTVALDRVIVAQNQWLADLNKKRQGVGGSAALTTLTALVIEGHRFTVAHVGDTRAWQADGAGDATVATLTPLTQDHAFEHPDQRARLTRALGLDDAVRIDYGQGEVDVGDTFLLTSDGVHGVLSTARIAAVLAAEPRSAQRAADALVGAALAAGSLDNASAIVLRVQGLDVGSLDDGLAAARRLPVPQRLAVGDVVDGFTVTAPLADNGVHRLVQARRADGALVVLKTLAPSRGSDPEERAMLAHEAWLGLRLAEGNADGFVRVHEVVGQSTLYVVFDWHRGRTLEAALSAGHAFSVGEVVQGAIAMARALGRLHRLGVVHRDVKPANLHLGDDGRWRLLDLGVAVSGREPKAQRELHAGTPSFMNPEQWGGLPADAGSDLFALGVTLYRWLTGRLPYGEIEPWQAGRYRRDPRPLSRLKPEVPIWLDHVVLKAVARDPKQRFETAEELLLALERGASRVLLAPPATPLALRDPLVLWRVAFGVSVLFNLLLVVWLLFLPR